MASAKSLNWIGDVRMLCRKRPVCESGEVAYDVEGRSSSYIIRASSADGGTLGEADLASWTEALRLAYKQPRNRNGGFDALVRALRLALGNMRVVDSTGYGGRCSRRRRRL